MSYYYHFIIIIIIIILIIIIIIIIIISSINKYHIGVNHSIKFKSVIHCLSPPPPPPPPYIDGMHYRLGRSRFNKCFEMMMFYLFSNAMRLYVL